MVSIISQSPSAPGEERLGVPWATERFALVEMENV
jgi:hypothetical protein